MYVNPATTISDLFKPDGDFPTPPAELLDWMDEERGLAKPTKRLYKYCFSRLFGYVKKENPDEEPSMWSLWDRALLRRFFAALQTAVPPTSEINFHSAFQSGRQFMQQHGRKPVSFVDLLSSFSTWSKSAHKRRRRHMEDQNNQERTRVRNILREFYLKCYHNAEFFEEFFDIVEDIKASMKAGKVKRLSASQLAFCTGLMIVLLTSCNFKRAGNLPLIEAVPAVKALSIAFAEFKRKFPKAPVRSAKRRLDPNKSVPAILTVDRSAKKAIREKLAVIRPRDQLAMLQFFRYVRRAAPNDVTTSKFFFNSLGRALDRNVWYYLRKLGERAGLKDLTFNELRRAIETENALGNTSSLAISSHLGHSAQTAKEYYVRPDDRHVAKTCYDLLDMFQEIGEADDAESQEESEVTSDAEAKLTKSLENQVSFFVSGLFRLFLVLFVCFWTFLSKVLSVWLWPCLFFALVPLSWALCLSQAMCLSRALSVFLNR